MRKTLMIAMAATGLALAGPVFAHHNSPFTEEIEGRVPDGALVTHDAAVEEVLNRLEDIGVSGAMGGETMSNDMDPADSASGRTCTGMFETSCDPGNVDNPSAGMDRGPSISP